MTRRGSLIYYFTAVICGCFFMSLAVWIKDLWGAAETGAPINQAFGILFFYFYGLILGAFSALLGAFLLRRLAARLKCKQPLHWALFGALLCPAVIAALGTLGRHAGANQNPGLRLTDLITYGPRTVLEAGWWLAIPAGAATGYLLGKVERAFAQPPSAVLPSA